MINLFRSKLTASFSNSQYLKVGVLKLEMFKKNTLCDPWHHRLEELAIRNCFISASL